MAIEAPSSVSVLRLSCVLFSAKIDYVTIRTPGKVKLPALSGRPVWPSQHHGERLSVHDASAADIKALIGTLGAAALIELEIAIDVRPRKCISPEQRDSLVQAVMVDIFARGLEPSAGVGMANQFRAFYRRLDAGHMVRPFNKGLPRATDQQLHGGRYDAVQVKGYLKRSDNKKALPPEKHCARLEVRLGSSGLLDHDLLTLTDLRGFQFRKKLMPYFRHVRGTQRLVRCKPGQSRAMLSLLAAKQNDIDQEHHAQVGVGAFLKGGKREGGRVRLLRDTPVNNRIGQALLRLERQHGDPKFVCPETPPIVEGQGWARISAESDQSCMTI